ncbi:hypothetical protein A6E13_07155 [Aliivibrio fischeri]|uniref:Uncharacterized protein n=1 Tax=Aliivibrio fischeri TaxID=668 RepID=A0A844P3U0_ALIFS|nr:AHH domain-containing protein [Aliivibrio fischeri]MUK50071.1 hypothetical protein [Aliivibrio fischeri]OCH27517.1 hypothetical protein A6E13_07155 [Aliivibrio fischeri]
MGIVKNEGRYIRSKSLRDSAIKRKHPLNFMDRAVASHHIISCEATRHLSSYRRKQITYKGYDINHPWNLVILPMKDRIACHYRMPLHKSGHKDEELITHYERSLGLSITNLTTQLKNEAEAETNQRKKKFYTEDIEVIDILNGYHKIIAVKLARTLKGLTCKSDPETFVETLDDLSIDIVGEISRYELLLLQRGKFFTKNQKGCNDCRIVDSKINRKHFGPLDNAPNKATVKKFCYNGSRLKTIKEQLPKKNNLAG